MCVQFLYYVLETNLAPYPLALFSKSSYDYARFSICRDSYDLSKTGRGWAAARPWRASSP